MKDYKLLLKYIIPRIKSRSFKSEILSGKKRLPIKYLYLDDLDLNLFDKIIAEYKDYLYFYEYDKYLKNYIKVV